MQVPQVMVQVSGVSKRFVIRKEKSLKERVVNFGRSNRHKEDFWALRDIDLEIMSGSTVGLIGPNGSGKSTLLKTIGGIIQPTTGNVRRRGRLAALLELGAGFHPDLTGRENVYLNAAILGLSRKETDERFDEIVEFSGISDFIDTQVKFYSSGMYVRLAFAVAVHVDADVLIVDEVLAVGDEPFQRKCLDRIRQLQRAGKTIVLVTHSLGQVGELCDRAIVLEHGNVVFDGDPSLAIQRLRSDFEVGVEATARGDIRIRETRLTGLTDDGELLKNGSLRIEMDLENAETADDLIVGFLIDSSSGQTVYGTNTDMLSTTVPGTASSKVVFQVDELHLGGGKYTLQAVVATKASGEVMRDPQAASFSVRQDRTAIGVAGAGASVAFEQPTAALDEAKRARTSQATAARGTGKRPAVKSA